MWKPMPSKSSMFAKILISFVTETWVCPTMGYSINMPGCRNVREYGIPYQYVMSFIRHSINV